jgi:hypothetical protein
MYGAALKNEAGGDGKQEYFCKVPNNTFSIFIILDIDNPCHLYFITLFLGGHLNKQLSLEIGGFYNKPRIQERRIQYILLYCL